MSDKTAADDSTTAGAAGRRGQTVLAAPDVGRVIGRMAADLLARHPSPDDLLLLGILTRGLPLAERLADEIEDRAGVRPPLGAIDITLYRDDLSAIGPQPVVRESKIPVPIDGRTVVLCDDVLYTGRTVRAALDELIDYGRPRAVRLAVLVDRGHRELPIQADVVGEGLETAAADHVEVGFTATDGEDFVRVLRAGKAG